jgi:hypothetical protein
MAQPHYWWFTRLSYRTHCSLLRSILSLYSFIVEFPFGRQMSGKPCHDQARIAKAFQVALISASQQIIGTGPRIASPLFRAFFARLRTSVLSMLIYSRRKPIYPQCCLQMATMVTICMCAYSPHSDSYVTQSKQHLFILTTLTGLSLIWKCRVFSVR